MKIKILLCSLLALSCTAKAQNMISMSSLHPETDTTSASKTEMAIRYPALRQFSTVANLFNNGSFTSKLNDKPFAEGNSKTTRISSYINTPVKMWEKNSLSATFYYTYTRIQVSDVTNDLQTPQLSPLTSNNSTLDLSLNYSRTDKLFKLPVVYTAVFSGISDNLNTIRRFNFNGSVSFPLIQQANTSLALGALLVIDPSSPLPVKPIISYYHKFTSSGIEVIVDIPTSVTVKKEVFSDAWLMFGTCQNSYSTFYNKHDAVLSGKTSYNTIEMQTGPAFEYLFAKKVILGVGGGVNTFLSSKLFSDGEKYSNAYIVNKNKAASYVNFSISLLPF